MNRMISIVMVLLPILTVLACSPTEPRLIDRQASPAATEAVTQVVECDVEGLVRLAGESSNGSLIRELRSMRWESVPPPSRTGLETAVHGDLRVQVRSEHFDFIEMLGERYERGELSVDEYVNSMLLIDGIMSGILHSHEAIHNKQLDPVFYAAQTVLAYAALARGAIDLELEAHALGDRGVLTDEHRKLLKIAGRDMKYELFDKIP